MFKSTILSKGMCAVGALITLCACVKPGKVSYSGETRPPAVAAASVGYLPEIPQGAEKLGILRVFCGGGAPCETWALQEQIADKVAEVGGTHLSHANCQSEHHSYSRKEVRRGDAPPPRECNRVDAVFDLVTLVGEGKRSSRCVYQTEPSRPREPGGRVVTKTREIYVITCTANVVRVGERPAP